MDLGLSKNYKQNPREHANILSILTLSFTLPTFFKGYKKDLEISDLYKTCGRHKSKMLGDKIEQAWEKEVKRAANTTTKPSLKLALIKVFGMRYMFHGFIMFTLECVVKMLQPTLLGQLILYFTPHQDSITKAQAFGYAAGIVACSSVVVLTLAPYNVSVQEIGMKIRVACCSLIYRKALRLSKMSMGQTTIGQMVNLLSNDVNRFDVAAVYTVYLLIGPLQTTIATYLMYQEVGVSAIIGVAVVLLFVPLQFGLAKIIAKLRFKTASKTDERVRLMNEVIAGIQVIKMYTWEKPFAKFVSLARRSEMKFIRRASYIKGLLFSFFLFSTQLCVFVSILSYVLLDNQITAKKVFVLNSYYNMLRTTMTNFFPQGIAQLAEANVSLNRLTQFMLYDEKPLTPATSSPTTSSPAVHDNSNYGEHLFIQSEQSVTIENGYAKWDESSSDGIFEGLNIKIKRGSVVAVIGPVGSGKSSLLQVLLKELPLLHGQLEVHGEISYAAQEPWLFTGTIRQNIIFNKPYDEYRYKQVVSKCSLTRDFSLFPYSDKTVVGPRGVSLSGGQRARINLARAVYQKADIYLMDDPLSAVDTHVGKELFDECIVDYLTGKTVILVTHQLQFLKDVDQIIILESGLVKAQGTFEELQSSGLDFAKLLQNEMGTEGVQQKSGELSREVSFSSTQSFDDICVGVAKQNEEQRTIGTVSKAIYTSYALAGSNWAFIFVVLLLFILSQTGLSFGDIFISRWVNKEESRFANNSYRAHGSFWDVPTNTSIYIYTGIIVTTVTLTILRSISFFHVCMKSSVKLHDNMFDSIINATMRFFNTNSPGRILNRFSKDMGSLDELLPTAMIDCFQIFLMIFGIIVVIATVNPWLLIPTVVITVIFILLRMFYLRTSRNLKRLEGVTRSPVFEHLNASLQGLSTIRAFGAESALIKEFDSLQDLHNVAWFLFISTSRAFGYWLDIVCAIFIALVTFSFLVLGDTNYGGNVGLAITQSLAIAGMFQWGMRQSAEVENQMTSVERVLEYNKIEHERSLQSHPNQNPPPSWPQKGEIKFDKVYLHYSPEDPPVLKNLSFTIKPLEKVGIVGRTGAGKSSLINALFQLTDTHGSIIIDSVDIANIGLHDLRLKISIIPQEPVLFSGTMRKNLDPFDEYTDEALWKSLEAVELKNVINELNLGLNSAVFEGGSNFSVGQRQLICLARAILRNNKILILDEATANVDPQTDALIQTTIRKEFANCTVLTIAHRLNTVMDSDKILVMDAGTMVEFDHPFRLLQNPDGILYSMVEQTGIFMTDTLINIAKESFERLQSATLENTVQ